MSSHAQDADGTATYKPRRADCQVAPIDDEAFAAGLEHARLLAATPSPVLAAGDGTDPLQGAAITEVDLPAGIPADKETVAAITALEHEFAACYDAGQFRRAAALLIGDLRAVFIANAGDPVFGDRFATPVALPKDERIPFVVVRDVRLLPDGRAVGILEWGAEANIEVYERVDGQWRIADEISIVGPVG